MLKWAWMLNLRAFVVCLIVAVVGASAQTPAPVDPNQALVKRYCVGCHNTSLKTAGVVLQGVDLNDIAGHAELLEKVLRKVATGQMPPPGMPHPQPAVTAAFEHWLETSLDAESAAHPNPGKMSVHRLNRAEYSNAVRDVLDLDVHPGEMLPVDDSGYGFDNIGDVLSMSPALLDRYLTVARKISRLAIGDPTIKPVEDAYEPRRSGRNNPVPQRLEWISDDLPFNSAGGVSVGYYFPLDAEYILRVKFGDPNSPSTPKPLEVRMPIKAGLRTVGVTFPRESLLTELSAVPGHQPEKRPMDIDLRLDGVSLKRSTTSGTAGSLPRITNLSISGPYNITGPGDTASRRKILICHPANPAEESACATKILTQLSRHAYRRPTSTADIAPLLAFYQQARKKGSFEYGIQKAVEAILVSPDFLFRVETNVPSKGSAGPMRPITGLDLASRLSFFLWSSVPDDELLNLAVSGKLSNPEVAEAASGAHAGRSEVQFVDRELRRPVAVSSQPRLCEARPHDLRRLGRKPALQHATRNGVILRQHRAREPQRPRSAARRLYVSERASREALRDPRNLRSRSSGASRLTDPNRGGLAGTGQSAYRDFAAQPDVGGETREMGAG